MGFIDELTIKDVVDAESFFTFAQQTCGVPYPTIKDKATATKQAKEFFKKSPNADWQTLGRVAMWARAKRRRYAKMAGLVCAWRFAWSDGFLPELDGAATSTDEETEERIKKALEVESDPIWRERLIAAEGKRARREVLDAWLLKKQVAA